MLGMVRDSHANVSAAKTRVQAQRKAFNDLNAERDSLRVEKESLAHAVEDAAARLADKDAELEVVNESRRALEKEVDYPKPRLAQTEAKVDALDDQNARLGARSRRRSEVNEAEARRRELVARHEELERTLASAQLARDEAAPRRRSWRRRTRRSRRRSRPGRRRCWRCSDRRRSRSALRRRIARRCSLETTRCSGRCASRRLDWTRCGRKRRRSSRRSRDGRRSSRRRTRRRCWSWRRRGGEGTLRPMLVEAQNREREALDRVEELERKLRELRATRGVTRAPLVRR